MAASIFTKVVLGEWTRGQGLNPSNHRWPAAQISPYLLLNLGAWGARRRVKYVREAASALKIKPSAHLIWEDPGTSLSRQAWMSLMTSPKRETPVYRRPAWNIEMHSFTARLTPWIAWTLLFKITHKDPKAAPLVVSSFSKSNIWIYQLSMKKKVIAHNMQSLQKALRKYVQPRSREIRNISPEVYHRPNLTYCYLTNILQRWRWINSLIKGSNLFLVCRYR